MCVRVEIYAFAYICKKTLYFSYVCLNMCNYPQSILLPTGNAIFTRIRMSVRYWPEI